MTVDLNVRRVALPNAPVVTGLDFRHFDPEHDYPAIAGLIGAANLNDGVDWLPEAAEIQHEWEHNDGFDLDEDVLLAEIDGVAVGFIQHDWRQRGERIFHQLGPLVHPAWRHRGLGRALLAWAEDRASRGVEAGTMGPRGVPHVLAGWADLEIADVAPFVAAAGYLVEGYGILMTRSLAEPIPHAELPEGLEVRPVRPEDHRRIWDADTEAFRDHRDPALRTESDFERWFTQPGLDTTLWEVAWEGDEVAGSSLNFIFPLENERLGIKRGWLEHISVRRQWRRRGVASALIARSMRRFRDLGLEQAILGADAENLSGAVRVYEALGFRRVRTAASYRKPMAVQPLPSPGTSPAR